MVKLKKNQSSVISQLPIQLQTPIPLSDLPFFSAAVWVFLADIPESKKKQHNIHHSNINVVSI